MDLISPVEYGNIIVFLCHDNKFFVLVQQYVLGSKSITDYVNIPLELHCKARQLYPLLQLSDNFLLLSVETIRHKCVNIPFDDLCCLSEIRIDHEHEKIFRSITKLNSIM